MRIHDQRKLCDYILSLVDKSSVPLRIAASLIPNAGSGLFVVSDVVAGADIFTSQPLLLVSEGNNVDVCDYCFLNKNSSVSPESKFFIGPDRDKINISACMACETARYCSKVWPPRPPAPSHQHHLPLTDNRHFLARHARRRHGRPTTSTNVLSSRTCFTTTRTWVLCPRPSSGLSYGSTTRSFLKTT